MLTKEQLEEIEKRNKALLAAAVQSVRDYKSPASETEEANNDK